jgi:fibronectin-binding autotransporter adhesin
MNRGCYRTIFSKRLGMLVAVSETTKARSKGTARTAGSGARVGQPATPSSISSCASTAAARVRPSTVAVISALWGAAAFASPPLPTGGVVTSGSSAISQSGNTLTVNQSSQSLSTNWQSFDIAADHAVVFNQPSNSSVALNRVVGADASSIYGSLSANGKVFLVNPNGVLFAPGAQVSAGGLVASTLDVSDADFAAGNYRFTNGAGKGSVLNEGTIQAGSVALLAPKVVNRGEIRTPGGNTTLAAGDRVTVRLMDGLISAEVDAAVVNAEIRNHGRIVADGGSVSMLAGRADRVVDSLINTDGVVQANSVRNENGRIFLDGGAGGTVYVSGALDASGTQAGTHGGEVTLLGKNVGVMQGARIEASGPAGGGTVLVGGDWKGGGPLPHADAVIMQAGARIDASATSQGDGGKVVLWSDRYTAFQGDIAARGGASGGNGGRVETSSHDSLQAFGAVDASASRGTAGQWLLDPFDVTIAATNGNVSQVGGDFTATGSPATIDVATINAALNAGTAVTVDTSGAGAEAGNITVSSAIAKTAGATTSLTLNATGAIAVNAGISSSSNQLAVNLNAAGGAVSGTGAINTNGGLLTINAASGSGTLSGVISGSGGLTKTGAGTTILSANNTFSGPTTITAGVLQLGAGGTTGALGSGAVTNDGTLVFNRSNALQITNAIDGTGSLLLTGGGTLTLAGNRTYSGGTTISNGTLQTSGNTAAGTGTVTLGDANTGSSNVAWRIAGANQPTNSIVVSSSGTGTVTLGGYTGGTFTIYQGDMQINRDIILLDGTGDRSSFYGILSGTGNITVTGTRVTFGNNGNTDSGVLTINPGSVLQIDANAAVRSNSAIVNNGVLRLNPSSGATAPVIQAYSGNGATNAITGGAVDLSIGFNDASGNYSGVISNGAAAVSITKIGNGTQVLSGNNVYTGTTTVAAGTLQVGNNGTTGRLGTGAVTVNGTLVFDRSDTVNLSTLASNAAGISGTGNVTALIGGGFTVDRGITLTGANSRILLEAGKNMTAGVATGGDVALNNNVSTSATGTVTIFSGNANTAAYETRISGANGATRYKYYSASAANASGAVAGTRNYYYRQQPALTVGGLTAAKVYDGLLDATAALDGSAAVVSGAIEGDIVEYADLTGASAAFDNAHAGTRGLNASFSAMNASYASGGTNWSVSGYSASYSNATAGTITPRAVSVAINPIGKIYDGLTDTTSTLNAPTGFVGNDSATGVSGFTLAFDDPNAGTRNVVASGTGSLTGFTGAANGDGSGVGIGNEVAGLASDYSVIAPTSASAVISQAQLIVTANDDAKLLTQSDLAGYNGVSYSGFVHGDTAATLSGTLSIARTNAGTEAAGDYAGVLVPSGLSSSNYTIAYVNGNYRILPAQQLLIRIQNVDSDYGTQPGYAVTSAQYLDADGTTIRTLTQTAASGNTYTYSDGIGGSATFTVAPVGVVNSSAGFLRAGNYVLAGTNTSITGSNFAALNYVGNQTVLPIGLTASAGGISKIYDGTTAMTGLTLGLTGAFADDALSINGSGAFNSRHAGDNVGYTVDDLQLSGLDAGNYYLVASAFNGTDGRITPRTITTTGITAQDKVYDGTTAATLTTAGYGLMNVVNGDAVDLDLAGASAVFDNRNAGAGKSVTTSLALSGADAGNYILAQPANLTASITPRTLTISAVSDTKTYDGTTASAGAPTITGLAAGDTVSGAAVQSFDNRNAGTGKVLTAALGTLAVEDGNGGGNYTLAFVNDANGVINPLAITVTAVPGSKYYDGTTGSQGMPVVSGGLAAGDRFTALGQQYTSAGTGAGLALVPNVVIDDGNGGANYVLTMVENTSGEIRPRTDAWDTSATHSAARLNGDTIDSAEIARMDADVRIVSTGIRMPLQTTGEVTAPAADTESDRDGDGVMDREGACPESPAGAPVDGRGCTLAAELRLPVLSFASASDQLQSEGRRALDDAVGSLRTNPEIQVEIAGHADATGSDAYNLPLSQRRAENVRRYLVERGVTNTLTVRAYGASQPVADNATPNGRARNRRVVLRIVVP